MSLDPLGALLEAVSGAGEESLVVFDLDDTLFSTANRHLRILAEFAADVERRDPVAARLLRGIPRERLRYSMAETARDAGAPPELAKELRGFWFARFFRNEYLLEDDPVPGAPEFVREVLARGGRAVLVTGRDEGMREGTLASLAKHGFPAPGSRRVELILKPTFEAPDTEFKARALERLAALGAVLGTFENEPAHVNLFAERFPDALHFLLETKHSGRPVAPSPAARRIPDFRRPPEGPAQRA